MEQKLNLKQLFFSKDAVDIKRQSEFENTTNKYVTKDNSNCFHIVELEDKKKITKELENYDPYKHRKVQHPTTFWETLFHLLKGSLGTGILAMPKAFENAGYMIGVIGTITIGLLSTYCIRVLIKSEYELCKRRKIPSMTYPGTMEASLEEGPQCFKRFAKYCPHITNTFLLIYQLGTCCVYTVFIAENLKKALDNFVTSIDVRIYMAALLVPLILINWVRNLKLLAPLSTIANGITFISFSIILYYLFRDPISFEGKDKVGDMSNFPLFLGTVLFALEAIGVIMPLENEMKKPKSFISNFGILNIGMGINIVLYVSMGLFGYIWHGKGVDGTITKNLPEDEILSTIVQILLAISIFITHSLQCYVAIDISWNEYIQPKIKHTSAAVQLLVEYVVRTLIVIITFILSISIPELELFISLFGALCLSALGISFPALIQTCAFWKVRTRRERIFLATKNFAVIMFGLLGLVIGTYTSLEKIIHKFTSD